MDQSQTNTLYGTTENRINTFGNVKDPKAVYRVFNAVKTENLKGEPDEVIKHMHDTYGVKLKFVRDPALSAGGGWDMSFEVVDEELYTLLLLKYT